MSCRSGVSRVGNQGLQPLRATVPFQLQNRPAPRCKDTRPAEYKTKGRPPKPTLRRTLSLDTLVGPYLQGNWPREPECQPVTCVNDKATQTPSSWIEETRGRRGGGGHKRSASWGSAEHLREVAKLRQSLQKRSRHAPPAMDCDQTHQHIHNSQTHSPGSTQTMPLIPLSRLAPRLRRSVEGLNLELEGVFVSETAKEQHKILDVPDGHRAPVPAQRYSSASQSDPSPAQLSPSHSPCTITDTDMVVCGPLCAPSSPPLCISEPPSSSPRPNKTYVFQREPPEGCERVRVSEEAILLCHGNAPLQPSCPDPNKVNFTPHGGSAFCPVSLLRPLLPSMDLLFRGLSVSPVTGCSAQSAAPCQTPGHAVGGYLSGTLPDPTTTSL
ncbi:protein FAM117A-like isoform X1 [Sinocyclocheilus anshuiensis]|uniref:Protein FAM117A-like n=1 Tax=Sinocyclocheilus anshuiensis TaxID=1608454 RepID=A0A671P5N8_9TELE|nr:PREDICTED: protein FAM117A-like isoform X1 [Sinocyclocheilus anshuiensis]